MKSKILFSTLFAFFLLVGCGQKNEIKGTGEKTSDSKTNKSEKTQIQKSGDTSKIDLSQLPKFKLAYLRDGNINIANSDLSNEKYLYKGYDNLISPDGSKVVYTQSNNDGTRNIAIFDVESKVSKVLTSPTGKQSFDACFSPDGKTIVFCNFSGTKWNIAFIGIDDTGFRIISDKYNTDLFCPTFAPDGNSILCQDMNSFIEFDLKGNILRTIPLKEVTGDKEIYFSSGNKGFFTNNKKEILFDADTQDFFETSREPISNIYTYNIETKTLKNLSDKSISTYTPFPLSDGKYILFSAYTKDDLTPSTNPQDKDPVIVSSIYIMNIDGTGKTKMLKDGYKPSASKVK